MSPKSNANSLSIVIAVWRDLAGLSQCLESLDDQCDTDVEVIVVSTEPIPVEISARFSQTQWCELAAEALIPMLWARGMSLATGELIAITTSQFRPAADWVAQIRAAHDRLSAPAIGGAIDPPEGRGATAWATYFLRYSQYLRYRDEQVVDELAADNASYKRGILSPDALHHGFWELEFHRQLQAAGEFLVYVSRIRVRQQASYGFWGFVSQRLRHGRKFGRDRARTWGLARRAAYLCAFPLIPIILLGKIVTRIGRGGRYFGQLAAALPVLCCFIAAWALGEAWGYLSTPDKPGARPSAARRSRSAVGGPVD